MRSDNKRKRFFPDAPYYPVTRFIPNLATLVGLSIGLTAVNFALLHQWEKAMWAILIATAFDGLDGRLARFFKASTRFGAELDSLSDFVTFGVSPALVIFLYSVKSLGTKGWICLLIYCMCAGLRLARFNTVSIEEDYNLDEKSKTEKLNGFFQGVPMPAAALLLLMPLMISVENDVYIPPTVFAIFLVVVGGLMVSSIPTYSFKGMSIRRAHVVPLLATVMVALIGIISSPWETLPIIGVVYFATFPFSIRAYKRRISEVTAN